jgi:hypothetical protein
MQSVDFGDLLLLSRPSPVPRSLVVFGWSSASDDTAALARIGAPDFDSNREVVLSSATSSSAGTVAPVAVSPDVDQPERWHARVSVPQDGYLLQREAWYPGWRARVDGVDSPMLRADLLFRAIPLTPGDHDVTIYFDSATFDRGAVLSVLGVLTIVAVLAWPLLAVRIRRRSHV